MTTLPRNAIENFLCGSYPLLVRTSLLRELLAATKEIAVLVSAIVLALQSPMLFACI